MERIWNRDTGKARNARTREVPLLLYSKASKPLSKKSPRQYYAVGVEAAVAGSGAAKSIGPSGVGGVGRKHGWREAGTGFSLFLFLYRIGRSKNFLLRCLA